MFLEKINPMRILHGLMSSFVPYQHQLSRMVLQLKKLPQPSWMDVGETFDTPSEKKAKKD